MCGTVYGDMNLKDLLGSIESVGYCITVPDFYLVPKKLYNGLIMYNLYQAREYEDRAWSVSGLGAPEAAGDLGRDRHLRRAEAGEDRCGPAASTKSPRWNGQRRRDAQIELNG